MENTIKISFSAVTHIGTVCTANDNRIFANGKFLHQSAADYAQISLEVNEGKCFFALSESMDDDESGISLINDLKKFHQKAINSSKDIHVKLDELVQCVEQSSNLLHSISLGENDFRERKPSFAGLLVDEGNIAAVNLGNCRIYKLEGDTFKLLVNDYKRAERLLKMGIISNEQAEMLSGQQKTTAVEGRSTVKKSDINTLRENTVYLICSSGLTDAISEDTIYDILASKTAPDEAAGQLVAEAVKNEAEGNVTAAVISIEDAGEGKAAIPGTRAVQYRSATGRIPSRQARISASKHRPSVDVSRIVSVVVLVFLAAAVVFGGFKLWTMVRDPKAAGTVLEQEDTLPEVDETTQEADTTESGDSVSGDYSPEDETETDVPADEVPDENTTPDTTGTDLVGSEGTTYVVKSGDMLMVIAKKFYGDESKYTLIMEANKITDPNLIAVGQELFIPPLE